MMQLPPSRCEKYDELYAKWVRLEPWARDLAKEALERHRFYCPVCRARMEADTERARNSIMPELRGD